VEDAIGRQTALSTFGTAAMLARNRRPCSRRRHTLAHSHRPITRGQGEFPADAEMLGGYGMKFRKLRHRPPGRAGPGNGLPARIPSDHQVAIVLAGAAALGFFRARTKAGDRRPSVAAAVLLQPSLRWPQR